MVMTISTPLDAAFTLPAACPPDVASASTCALLMSKPCTAWPALSRFCAIGRPMLPRPMKPIFAMRPPPTPYLLRLNLRRLSELYGHVGFLGNPNVERIRRHDHLLDTERREFALGRRIVDRLGDLGLHLGDHVARRLLWHEGAHPEIEIGLRHAGLDRGRHVGQRRRALGTRHRERQPF